MPFYAVPDYVKYPIAKTGIYLGYDILQEEARYYYNGKTRYVNTTTSFEKKIDYTIGVTNLRNWCEVFDLRFRDDRNNQAFDGRFGKMF